MSFTPPHLLDGARWTGLRIGLLGGSFNPPHPGHTHISLIALQALQLDFVWWLLTPNNPLKDPAMIGPYENRLRLCREMNRHHPRILVTDLERQMGVNKSFETVRGIRKAFPRTDFIWITGMDNALTFHHWHHWQDILALMPTAHIARPPALTLIEQCPLKMLRAQNHHYIDRSRKADLTPGNTYWLLQRRMVNISSTEIRNNCEISKL